MPYRDPAGGEAILAAHGKGFDLLLGRRTYDIWSDYWPKAEKSPMADSLNAVTKYVATHRPDSLGWGPFECLGPDIVEGVRRIKAKDGPDLIVWGSSTLTTVLLEHGLADEVLLLDPVGRTQTFLFGWSPATRTRARRHEGCVLGRRHQHLQAQRAFADRLLRRRGGVSRRQRSCRERDDDHYRGLLLEGEYVSLHGLDVHALGFCVTDRKASAYATHFVLEKVAIQS